MQDVMIASPDFRCERCAVLEVDHAAHRQTRSGLVLIGLGAVVLGFAVLMWMANWNPGEGGIGDDDGMGLLFYVGTGAVGLFGIGFGMLKYRPRLKH